MVSRLYNAWKQIEKCSSNFNIRGHGFLFLWTDRLQNIYNFLETCTWNRFELLDKKLEISSNSDVSK